MGRKRKDPSASRRNFLKTSTLSVCTVEVKPCAPCPRAAGQFTVNTTKKYSDTPYGELASTTY